jgi:hypothetical protein
LQVTLRLTPDFGAGWRAMAELDRGPYRSGDIAHRTRLSA